MTILLYAKLLNERQIDRMQCKSLLSSTRKIHFLRFLHHTLLHVSKKETDSIFKHVVEILASRTHKSTNSAY